MNMKAEMGYLHQLLAVLPRNSDVSEFHRKILNPSHPERSSGLIANWYPAGPDFVSLAAGLPSAPPFAIICGWGGGWIFKVLQQISLFFFLICWNSSEIPNLYKILA